MKNKKIISLLLALMMMLSVVPMYASAAEPIALTEANVVTWPTIEGEIYFGQKLSDGFTLSGGLVTSTGDENGSAITGKFEFIDPNYVPTSTSGIAALKFIPENTIEYQGFDVEYAWDVLYSVKTITPVLADPNSPPVATPVEEAGNRLSTSTISGGAVKNPYTGELLAGEWYWTNRRTKVEEGGYYPAELSVGVGYDVISMDIYVGIVGDAVETTITEKPTIPEIIYTPGLKWQDISLVGGKAVALGTETEVAGTFSHSLRGDVTAGTQTIDVTFTPNDITTAKSSTCQITVTINKAPIKFVDENGAEIVPEITVPYGTKLTDGNMKYYISQAGCTAVAGNDGCWYDGTDADGYIFGTSASGEAPEVGTHYYEFIARPYTTVGVTSNYAETVLKLKVTVTPVEAEMKLDTTPIKGTDGLELWVWNKDTSSAARPEGTFTVYLDGAVYKENLKYGEHFTWQPAQSKTYEFKATYTPTENDPFTIADFTMSRDIKLTRKLTASENILSGYGDFKYGATVEINANVASDNFAGWKITDAQGNEVALDGVDNSKTKITITMPDYDIHVEALEKNATSGGSGGLGDIDFGDLSEGDSEWAIINIIRNIIAMFKSFLQQLIETFQSIGG